MEEKKKRVRPYLKLIVRTKDTRGYTIIHTQRFAVSNLWKAYETTRDWSMTLTAVYNDCELWLLSDVGMLLNHWTNGKEQLF